jgi:hypothetical protein
MTVIKVYELLRILENAWCAETAMGEWKVPSMNQCAVTSLVVQDFFGGRILRCEMTDGDSHYWNEIDGEDIDLTQKQFLYIKPQPKKETTEIRTRQYILSYPNTMKRYGILLQRVAEAML